ncbi:hypothetical protein F5Y19DRAFT_295703 [Xylariaceae sp. FL1651]|nr:hypothetical protein F5Y19DRAFT_295703 [Xylariaceae sp. FL1651]
MLEYFSSKKSKKNREEKTDKQKSEKEKEVVPGIAKGEAPAKSEAAPTPSSPKIISKPDDTSREATPILDHEDEEFLERLTSPDAGAHDDAEEDEDPPPLPPRVKTPVIDIDSDASSMISKDEDKTDKKGKGKDKGKEKEKEKPRSSGDKPKRFSFVTNLSRNISMRRKPAASGLKPDHLAVPSTSEASHEKKDMARVLDDLNLSAQNNKAFSLSAESAEMVRKFTQVLKDLVNGVPTAYGDLVKLLDDRDGILARNYEKLPKSLKKLVAQLPEKLTSTLAPELLVAAAEAQGLHAAEEGGKGGLKGAAKKFLTPGSLHDLVTKPGAVVGLLKGIVNALKTRFPAFVGTNVLWSLAVFLLLSMLWYCHKRGREVRLEREASELAAAEGPADDTIDGKPRVEELPDDPQLPAPGSEVAGDAFKVKGGSATGANVPVTGKDTAHEKAEKVHV